MQQTLEPEDPNADGGYKTELRRVYYMIRLSLEDIENVKKDVIVTKMAWKETDADGNVYEVHVKVHREP